MSAKVGSVEYDDETEFRVPAQVKPEPKVGFS